MVNVTALILLYSSLYRVDPALVEAVIEVESNFSSDKVGELGELGMMQLRPEYFYAKDLHKPETNLKLGIEYLARVKQECKHKKNNTFVVCYNFGITGGNKLLYPEKQEYYKRVMYWYNIKRRKYNAKDSSIQDRF